MLAPYTEAAPTEVGAKVEAEVGAGVETKPEPEAEAELASEVCDGMFEKG